MNDRSTVIEDLPQTAPADEHNRELVGHVHPTDWTNPAPADRYNMVVIGGGTAGLVTAAGAAGLGAKVALVERALLGGDCLNVGCVPSKALIRCARAAADVRTAGEFGVRVPGEPEVDFPAIMERMRRLRASISHHDSAARFRDLGVDVFIGEGRFISGDTVQVGDARLRFARACIATGARAFVPTIDGLDDAGYLTNETVFSLTQLPRRLAVIGGGPIGCELAQTFARFGSEVHMVEMGRHVLGREDPDAAKIVQDALVRDGVKLHLQSQFTAVRTEDGSKTLVLETGDDTREIACDEILVAVGRAPNVQNLGLSTASVEYDEKSGVAVDERLRTTNKRIFAAGDVCFPYKFTHTADAMARMVIRNALFFGRAKTGGLIIPWCTYTDPEIAHVGLAEHDVAERGIEIDTYRIDLADVDRAILDGETEGFLKVHAKKGKDDILGATLVARHAGEMISEVTATMRAGKGLATLSDTIHCYPTQVEAIRKAGDAYSRSRLTGTVKTLFEKFLAWRR